MSSVAIQVMNVTKYYKLYENFITGPIKEKLFFWKSGQYFKRFPALRDVSLTVKRGEIVGIVGPNGSGKTTLLKSIAGMLPVDQGAIEVNGKITALLAHGAGVHPEFTGRENILYGGLLLGMSKKEILRKMSSIIEFSELGEYIDRPFRTYSSGMRARLLFSISMSIDPDILIIDEALATGDAYFVRKCRRRIHEICRSGATVMFVSHDPTQIEELCNQGIFMVGGQVFAQGSPPDVIRQYYSWIFEKEKHQAAHETSGVFQLISGSGEIQLSNVELLDAGRNPTTGFYAGDRMTLRLHYESPGGPVSGVRVIIGILVKPDLTYVGEMDSSFHIEKLGGGEVQTLLDLGPAGVIDVELDPLLLINNTYSLWIKLYTVQNGYHVFCEYKDVVPFFVSRRTHSLSRGPVFWHPFQCHARDRSDTSTAPHVGA